MLGVPLSSPFSLPLLNGLANGSSRYSSMQWKTVYHSLHLHPHIQASLTLFTDNSSNPNTPASNHPTPTLNCSSARRAVWNRGRLYDLVRSSLRIGSFLHLYTFPTPGRPRSPWPDRGVETQATLTDLSEKDVESALGRLVQQQSVGKA